MLEQFLLEPCRHSEVARFGTIVQVQTNCSQTIYHNPAL